MCESLFSEHFEYQQDYFWLKSDGVIGQKRFGVQKSDAQQNHVMCDISRTN